MKQFLTVGGAYLIAWGVVAGLWLRWTNEAADRGRRVIALAERHADRLRAPETLPPLGEACRGRLEATSPRGIAAYLAPTAVKPADGNAWDDVLVGVTDEVVHQQRQRFVPAQPSDAIEATLNPVRWRHELERARAGGVDLIAARYLVVAKYFTLELPVNEGTDGYTRGGGTFSASVIALSDGEALCEGRGEVSMKETVMAAGRGDTQQAAEAAALDNAAKLVPYVFSRGVTTSPLHAVCAAGGDALCAQTSRWVGR